MMHRVIEQGSDCPALTAVPLSTPDSTAISSGVVPPGASDSAGPMHSPSSSMMLPSSGYSKFPSSASVDQLTPRKTAKWTVSSSMDSGTSGTLRPGSADAAPIVAKQTMTCPVLRDWSYESSVTEESPAYQEKFLGRAQILTNIRAQRQARDQEADEASSCCYRSTPPYPPLGRPQRLPRNADRTAAALAAVGIPPPRHSQVEYSGLLGWVMFLFARAKCCSTRAIEDS